MQIHNLKSNNNKTKKRVGRGGKKGTYSGKGVKGQRSRAGRRMQPSIRELIKRYPKLRGYRQNKAKNYDILVNLAVIEKKFEQGDVVSPKILLEKKIIKNSKSRVLKIKILGAGKLTKKIIFENCAVSNSAKQKIEKIGGVVKQETKSKK